MPPGAANEATVAWSSVAQGWADPVAAAVRNAKGQAARLRMEAPAAGRLEVRMLDARGRTLGRATLRFGKAGRKTLRLPRVRRRAETIRVAWTPQGGATDVVRRRLR